MQGVIQGPSEEQFQKYKEIAIELHIPVFESFLTLEVYDKDGTLIAEHDPSPETFQKMDLLYFARWVKDM